jgi:hypothetical protein
MSRRSSSWNGPYYVRLGLKKVDRAEAGPDHLEIFWLRSGQVMTRPPLLHGNVAGTIPWFYGNT